jgi:hypothetical protein
VLCVKPSEARDSGTHKDITCTIFFLSVPAWCEGGQLYFYFTYKIKVKLENSLALTAQQTMSCKISQMLLLISGVVTL